MALIGHWPLTGNLNDYSGNNNHLLYINNNSKLIINNNGKIGQCYERVNLQDGADLLRTTNKIFLNNDFTIMCWAFVSDAVSSANGLITNHSHSANTGPGITVRRQSADDYRISCNTGTGTSRTYNAYYGTSNIKNKWSHLTMRYNSSTESFDLLVNGIIEKTQSYIMKNIEDYFEIFSWSTSYSNSSAYRPASKINDVRVYNELLSLKQIQYLAKAKVLHYTFDNPIFIRDFSGFQNHGELSPIPPVWTENGRIGIGSFSFSSGNHYINLPNDIGYRDEFSAIAWFKSNGTPGSGYHILFGGSYLEISIPTNGQTRIGVHISNVRKVHNFFSTLTNGEWHQVGMVYDGDYKIAYVDGVEVGRTQIGPNLTQQSFTNRRIGTFGTSTNYYANGNIDDVRIYATALSSEEIKQLYNVQINFDNLGNVQASNFVENEILIKMKKEGIVEIFEIDEVSGTANPNAQQEITKTGTLKINGEFSEVD